MLSLPPDERPAVPEPPIAALREVADASPAIVWIKDLEGRYLYVNARYANDLDISEERLRGRTDAELPVAETVDGPRLQYAEDGLQEPLQLEYTVPPFDGRPSLVAFRFALRDVGGDTVGTCGVAAPTGEAQVARDEAVRLMQLERWNRLDPADVRAELLEHWHVQAGPAHTLARIEEPEADVAHLPAREAPSETEAPPQSTRVGEGDGAPGRMDPARTQAGSHIEPTQTEIDLARGQPGGHIDPTRTEIDPMRTVAGGGQPHREEEWVRQLRQGARINGSSPVPEPSDLLQSDLELARKWAERAHQLQGELQQSHGRIRQTEAELQQSLALAHRASEEASRWRSELEQTRIELERAQADAHAARSEVEATRRELGASRAQAESLRGPSSAALRLSEELGRALAAERERGDELAHTLARVRARLGDLESALEANQAGPAHGF